MQKEENGKPSRRTQAVSKHREARREGDQRDQRIESRTSSAIAERSSRGEAISDPDVCVRSVIAG